MAKRRRLLFRGFLIVLLATVFAGLASPWWLPYVVRLIAPLAGIGIEDHTTESWRTVVYRGVSWEGGNVNVLAERVRVPTWLVVPVRDGGAVPNTSEPSIVVEDVAVVVAPSQTATPERAEPSLARILEGVEQVWPHVRRWVPPATAKRVELDAGNFAVLISEASWDGRQISTTAVPARLGRRVELVVALTADDGNVHRVHASLGDWGMAADLDIRRNGNTAEIDGNVSWQENSGQLSVSFPEIGLVPSRALLNVPGFVFDAALLKMDGYQPIRGTMRLEWSAQGVAGRLTARAEPDSPESTLPPLSVDLRAVGDLRQVRLEAANVALPGVTATLSKPVEIELPRGVPLAPAEFGVSAQLDDLPWIEATGQLAGRLSMAASDGFDPVATFELAGTDIGWNEIAIEAVELGGRWDWPVLSVESFRALLAGEGRISGNAVIDFKRAVVERGEVSASLDDASLKALLVNAPDLGGAELSATFSGPLKAPEHLGKISWSALGGLPGGAIEGTLDWAGTGINSMAVNGEVASDAGVRFPVDALLTRDSTAGLRALVQLNRLSWIDDLGEWWSLESPGSGYVEIPENGGQPRLEITNLRMRGEEMAASADARIEWPGRGNVSISVENFTGSRMAAWLPGDLTQLEIEHLRLETAWDDGPVAGQGSLRASYHLTEDNTYYGEVDFEKGKEKNLTGELRVMDAAGVVARGNGMLPIEIVGRDDGFSFKLLNDAPLSLDMESTSNALFWESIEELTGWHVVEPSLSALLSGSIGQLDGWLEFTAARIIPPEKSNGMVASIPELRDLTVRVAAEPDQLVLEKATLDVEGNRIRASGSAAWAIWQDVLDGERFRWNETAFELSADPVPLSIVAQMFPAIVVPEGEVRIDVRHAPGTGFDGTAVLSGASLRPITPLGSVREINGEMSVDGYTVELSRLESRIGGRPLSISGDATVHPGEFPVFDIRVQGTRVPLVRSAGLILRAGLDLHIARVDENPARVTGKVDLGSSVFFSDLSTLIGSGSTASPTTRPPYFSVGTKPFSDWQIDLEVYGDRFLQLDVVALQGKVSADFRLEGTLGQPRATGRASLDDSLVVFPFAVVPLDSAEVTLLPSDPYTPRLSAVGNVQVYGYDLRMEVSGTSSDPQIRFTGDPPITSQEGLLILTAGELPRSQRTFTTSERAQRLALNMGRTLIAGFGILEPGADSRIKVRSSEQFTEQGRDTVYVQLDITNRWSLVGEYDRFDAYNGGVKFRILEK